MKKLFIILVIFAMPLSAQAIDKHTVEDKTGVKIKNVNSTPVPGIFEIVTNDKQIFYIDDSGKYLFNGNIIDLDTRTNITQTRVEEISRVDFSSLPFKNAIKTGSGKKKIAVFHDPDCPYCRKLFIELEKLKDVEIYNFVFFVPELHPSAYEKAKKIYCSKTPVKALEDLMQGKSIDNLKSCDTNIVELNATLAKKVGVRGTPHAILEDGSSIRGFRSVEYFENKLAAISK